MLLAVLPETSCQGLFNQIHRKATKKCQKHFHAPDTQVGEVSLVWAVSLRKVGSPLLIFIMFPLYTVATDPVRTVNKQSPPDVGK